MLWDDMKQESLDWEVGIQHVYRRDGTIIKKKMETFRIDTDEHIGVVSPEYAVLQNSTCREFVDAIPDSTLIKSGTFDKGTKVWWVVQHDGHVAVGDDVINRYSVLVNGHDGRTGFRWFITPIRPSCSNMMNLLLQSATDFNINVRHTKNIEDRVAMAAELHADALGAFDQMGASFAELQEYDMTGYEMFKYIAAVFKMDDTRTKKNDAILTKVQENFYEDNIMTRWGALNAVTKYIDHQRPSKVSRFQGSLTGAAARMKQRAFELLVEGPDGPSYLHPVSECVAGNANRVTHRRNKQCRDR